MTPDAGHTGAVHVLTDLDGWDPALGDPGRDWHPRTDSPEWAVDGTLRDLTTNEVYEHTNKPESDEQLDGYRRRISAGGTRRPLSAEDSHVGPDGTIYVDRDEGRV